MSLPAPDPLRPLALYEAIYAGEPRRFATPQTPDPAAWQAWRAGFRAGLAARLGLAPAEGLPPPPVLVAAPPVDCGDYRRAYIEFEASPGVHVPAWLLTPAGLRGPAPAVVAAHGHGHGADALVGVGPDGAERPAEGFHQSFAVALCRRGMLVIAPELRGFGRRREPEDVRAAEPGANSCHPAAWWGIMLGRPLLGSRVWDSLRALDLLQAMPEVDPGRVGIMGGSGGGAVALMAAALDPRLRAAVISSYFCTFRDSILAMRHCHCNYVPGLLQDGEMHDIAALIAPRPLLIEAGAQDPIFPLPGVLEAYAQLRGAYAALGAEAQLERDIFEGGHQIGGARAYDFLWQRLTA